MHEAHLEQLRREGRALGFPEFTREILSFLGDSGASYECTFPHEDGLRIVMQTPPDNVTIDVFPAHDWRAYCMVSKVGASTRPRETAFPLCKDMLVLDVPSHEFFASFVASLKLDTRAQHETCALGR